MMESDASLVTRTLEGDRDAFEILIKRYERSVRSVAWAFLLDFHECEDIAQETFIATFRALPTLRDRDKFGSWLMQIARRMAGKFKEQHTRRPILTGFDEPLVPTIVVNTRSRCLLSLIERLQEHEQILIRMRYFDGLSCQEIADATCMPLGTITKKLSRAYEHLRKTLLSLEETHHE